jgi:hypothetical protein
MKENSTTLPQEKGLQNTICHHVLQSDQPLHHWLLQLQTSHQAPYPENSFIYVTDN